jgi:hypothetical protein
LGGKMKKQSLALLTLAFALAATSVARADSFAFTFNDGAVSGLGTLTGTYEGAGNPWLITSGSGTFTDPDDTGSITLIANPSGPGGSSSGGVGCPSGVGCIVYDDLLDLFQVSGAYLDQNGLLFQFGVSGDYLNLFFSYSVGGGGPVYYGWYDSQGNGDYSFEGATGNFTITSYDIPGPENVTPEPGSFLLLGTGLFAIAGLLLRRRAAFGMAL